MWKNDCALAEPAVRTLLATSVETVRMTVDRHRYPTGWNPSVAPYLTPPYEPCILIQEYHSCRYCHRSWKDYMAYDGHEYEEEGRKRRSPVVLALGIERHWRDCPVLHLRYVLGDPAREAIPNTYEGWTTFHPDPGTLRTP